MHRGPISAAGVLLVSTLLGAPLPAQDPCRAADDGSGTVELPPPGCSYLSPDDVHMIIAGLPPGTEIRLSPLHTAFICLQQGGCGAPGGGLGGERELFDSTVKFEITGTGALADFRRIVEVPVGVETHTGPRTPGQAVQNFPTEMVRLQGSLFGDPDFDELTVRGGTSLGLPGPGETTLTRLGSGDFQVDSFFDVTYEIEFQGAPGGALEGFGGTTEGLVRMEARGVERAVEPAVDGTVRLPPANSKYVGPGELHRMIDGLPPGTTIEIAPEHRNFFCPGGDCGRPGGSLDGEVENFDSILSMQMRGTGELEFFERVIELPIQVETHTAPRDPLTSGPQRFETDMQFLQGQLPAGDPDFDFLQVIGGTGFGLPSPGRTALTDLGEARFQVDSFFDITYQIEFQGAPGGALDGFGGLTEATVRMSAVKGHIFTDGFESGDLAAWSTTIPKP